MGLCVLNKNWQKINHPTLSGHKACSRLREVRGAGVYVKIFCGTKFKANPPPSGVGHVGDGGNEPPPSVP